MVEKRNNIFRSLLNLQDTNCFDHICDNQVKNMSKAWQVSPASDTCSCHHVSCIISDNTNGFIFDAQFICYLFLLTCNVISRMLIWKVYCCKNRRFHFPVRSDVMGCQCNNPLFEQTSICRSWLRRFRPGLGLHEFFQQFLYTYLVTGYV